MDRERGERMSMESQLRDRTREIAELQARYDAHSAELNARWAIYCNFDLNDILNNIIHGQY